MEETTPNILDIHLYIEVFLGEAGGGEYQMVKSKEKLIYSVRI